MNAICPNCGSSDTHLFYTVSSIPTNSCLLVASRKEALGFQTGDIQLTFCRGCTFIFNASFALDNTIYSELYEETQAYSPTFNAFHQRLAEELINRYGIRGKSIIEIGCGKGEFLSLLCQLGGNQGIGYDPSFVPERFVPDPNIRFIRDFFSEETEVSPPDLLCCKMTLEHIPQTRRFIRAVRRVVSIERGTIVFFQVPNAEYILQDRAFWDVYYEHCSYFTRASLASLFCQNGFEILRLSTSYDDQYLAVEARPTEAQSMKARAATSISQVSELATAVAAFSQDAQSAAATWLTWLRKEPSRRERPVLWGSGSKAIAFLSTLGIRDEIRYAVDINPFRQGKFIPGTGQAIVAPSFLREYRPTAVIAMNPIYIREINEEMSRLSCVAPLYSVTQHDLLPQLSLA